MGEILKGATLVELNPPRVEKADLRIEGGAIAARAESLGEQPGDRVTELEGKLILPGLVVAHTHLYSALARGMPPPSPSPRTFLEVLERVWWRLDRALDPELVALSAEVGGAEALLAGVTTVIDHHASPSCVEGSLALLRGGLERVGVRGVLCYEVTDRHGVEGREAALRETEAFLRGGQTSLCRAMVGAHASFTLEEETLQALAALSRGFEVGVHLHVGESRDDEKDAMSRCGKGAMARLIDAGLVGPRSILSHCTQLSWDELSAAQQTGAWLVHNARSNMHNAVGYAPANKFGARKALGTDGLAADLFAEGQLAALRAQEAEAPIELLKWLSGGHTLASEIFGAALGTLEAGAVADLIVLDYPSPTPLVAQNLESHAAFGFGAAHVDAAMVDGAWRVWARQLLGVDHGELCARSREAAQRLWNRMAEL
jgi:putative selenium metabolism protein SsnA